MSPRFAPEDIDLVRERADIVEIVGEHVRLKRAGRSWKGLCPFHQEKTPSFTVDREKGVYHCFGCGVGGSVFTFLEEVEGLSFPEVVETLANRYGVQMREVSGGKRAPSPRARLIALHESAVALYGEMLAAPDAVDIRAYLAERGIAPELVERHRVGFGGWSRNGLVKTMVAKGFTAEEIEASGLGTKDGRGIRDTFHGRLLFPIFDPSDRPIAFGGRVLPESIRRRGAPDGPKYLNSRETPIFRKAKVLYGTNWARGEVVRAKRLVLVEGYTDVIALHAAGIGEAVATCGTSLTEQHMKEISTRFGDVRVVLCLDADAAGQAAMSRERTEELAGTYSPGEHVSGGRWLPVGRGWLPEVYVANLPAGADPADFALAEGREGIDRVLDVAVPLVEFLLRRSIAGEDLTTPEGRIRAVRKGADVLRQVGDGLLRHEYSLWLADLVRVDAFEVNRAVEEAVRQGSSRRTSTAPASIGPVVLTGHQRIEREALRALATHPDLFENVPVAPEEEDFSLPHHRALYRLLRTEREQGGGIDLGRLAAKVQDEQLRGAVSGLAASDPTDRSIAHETLVRLKGFALSRHIQERKERLRTLHPDRDAAAYDALFEELLRLEKERRAFAEGNGV